MQKNIQTIVYLAIAAVVMTIMGATYVVTEMDQVVITQFGKPVGDPIIDPGVHFKLPYIQNIHRFEKRFLEWDGSPNQVPTRDKKFLWVDLYARWQISDPLLFFQRLRDERSAQSRLDDILDGETRNAIAKHDLVEIVRNSNREFEYSDDTVTQEDAEFSNVEKGRQMITNEILQVASPRLAGLGIALLDLRLKRVNYVEEVRTAVYERMITERVQVAEKFRSEGQGEASKILGDKERELSRIQSEAARTAEEIKGKADAEATAIYAAAYNRNASTREFYQFTKSLETYVQILDPKSTLLLSTDSDLFKYLRSPRQ
jgi:modulator of FtsH protease HflC